LFLGEENRSEKFTGNKNWKPPSSKSHQAISALEDILKEDISKLVVKNKIRSNISKREREALITLRYNRDITVKNSDKGGSIVILDTVDYVQKIENMLSDPVTYTPNQVIQLNTAKSEVDKVIFELFQNNYISNRQKRFFCNFIPRMPIFYGLPKIHKKDFPLRPIVSQIDSPSYKLNKYLDYILTTAEKEIPYLLQDTTRFLQYLNNLGKIVNKDPILFTIDVTSLYTVLPHKMCIEYVTEMYSETIDKWNLYTPDIKPINETSLQKILETVLHQTFFQFNDKTYTQNYGITMGAPSSVKIANITLYKHLQKIQANYTDVKPDYCYRLIDDIFGLWLYSEEQLFKWFNFLNDSHNTIKFTIEFSKKEIPFLDTLVYLENNELKTKLYKKPTDNKQYLLYNSEHPNYMKNATPYAQALRYRRITSDDKILDEELKYLRKAFISRGYPKDIVDPQILNAQRQNQLDTIRYNAKTNRSINFTPFVLTFSNVFNNNGKHNIYKIMKFIWEELTQMTPILTQINPPKIIFRKCSSIANCLQSSKFPPNWWFLKETNNQPIPNINRYLNTNTTIVTDNKNLKDNICKPCKGKKCQTCDIIGSGSTFSSSTYNKTFILNAGCSCNSKDLIYLITCTKCSIQYVGETGQNLRDRINNHKSTIRTGKKTPISIHFNSTEHTIDHLSVVPIEILFTNNLLHRRTREFYWQLRLGTIFPKGLNNFPVNYTSNSTHNSLNTVFDFELLHTLAHLANC